MSPEVAVGAFIGKTAGASEWCESYDLFKKIIIYNI